MPGSTELLSADGNADYIQRVTARLTCLSLPVPIADRPAGTVVIILFSGTRSSGRSISRRCRTTRPHKSPVPGG